MIECDCKSWAVTDMPALMLGNGHNHNCPKYKPHTEAINLLKQLAEGIRQWASQEDGVPDDLWEAYSKAVFIVTGSTPSEGDRQ